MPHVVVLAIDRWNAAYFGALGNTWIHTPVLDRLAADSFLFERATCDSPNLAEAYWALWLGRHPLAMESPPELSHPSLLGKLNSAGWHTRLSTDERDVAEHPLAEVFSHREWLRPSDNKSPGITADTVEATDAATFFAAAEEAVAQLDADQPTLLWLHTGTLGRTWDAPLEFRARYAGQDDPDPSESAIVPNVRLPREFDPDIRTAYLHAYAGQVTLVDQLLESLLETIDGTGRLRLPVPPETLFILLSPRGFPLGEHGRVGPCEEALFNELTHVPLLLRFPKHSHETDRSQAIVQPSDLAATIAAWCGLPSPSEIFRVGESRSLLPLVRGEASGASFDRAVVVGTAEQKIITPAWTMRIASEPNPESTNSRQCELFAAPDDLFEVNEVADRAPRIVEELQTALADFDRACANGATTLAPLSPELVSGLE